MLEVPAGSVVRATLRALLSPRRVVPIVVVAVPLLWAQARWSVDPWAVPLGVVMVLSFVAVAPVSYRVLFPDGLDFSHGAVRLVLYALVGAGVILSVGAGVPKILGMQATFLTERTSLAVSTALFLVGGWGLGRDIGFEERLERLRREAERARLLALKAHLDPHFLFNTLSAIAEWCRIDGEVAERAVLALSALLRSMLEGVREPWWRLAQEVDLSRKLLELHLLRDQALFTFHIHAPEALLGTAVPPMCLTTLVENAVKHGPGRGHRGLVRVEVSRAGDGRLTLEVENPGPLDRAPTTGTGLSMLRRHLEVAYGGAASLLLEPVPGTADVAPRTRARVILP